MQIRHGCRYCFRIRTLTNRCGGESSDELVESPHSEAISIMFKWLELEPLQYHTVKIFSLSVWSGSCQRIFFRWWLGWWLMYTIMRNFESVMKVSIGVEVINQPVRVLSPNTNPLLYNTGDKCCARSSASTRSMMIWEQQFKLKFPTA